MAVKAPREENMSFVSVSKTRAWGRDMGEGGGKSLYIFRKALQLLTRKNFSDKLLSIHDFAQAVN
jgi:hypothetical protein